MTEAQGHIIIFLLAVLAARTWPRNAVPYWCFIAMAVMATARAWMAAS